MDNILSNLQAILSNGLFGITLTIVGYLIGLWLNRKFKTPILNPLLIAMVLIIQFYISVVFRMILIMKAEVLLRYS